MNIPITFKDFKTEKNYLALQNKFAGWDMQNPPNEPTYKKVIKTDFFINYKTVNFLTEKEEYKELYFIKDFLLHKISALAKRYVIYFQNSIESDLLFDKNRIQLYSEIQLKKIIEIEEIVKNSDYLIENLRLDLLVQIEIVIDYLKNIHILPNYTVDDKFKFNLNKTDVLVLFTLLRKKKIINSTYDNEFGFLIEKNCLYKNEEKYTPIKNASKVVNDIKNSHRPIEKSIVRLKNIFMNEDFYNLEI